MVCVLFLGQGYSASGLWVLQSAWMPSQLFFSLIGILTVGNAILVYTCYSLLKIERSKFYFLIIDDHQSNFSHFSCSLIFFSHPTQIRTSGNKTLKKLELTPGASLRNLQAKEYFFGQKCKNLNNKLIISSHELSQYLILGSSLNLFFFFSRRNQFLFGEIQKQKTIHGHILSKLSRKMIA